MAIKPTSPAAFVGPATALALLVLAFLPIANWIPGGHEYTAYAERLSEWWSGTAIVVGGGLVAAILSRRMPALWREGLFDGAIRGFDRAPLRWTLAIAALGLAIYLVIAHGILSARPLLIDEIVQLYQGQMLTAGELWRPVPEHSEFFRVMHVVDTEGGRVYGQFPPGGPLLLAIGVLLGAPWLIVPLTAAISIGAFSAYLRVAEPHRGVRLGALLLFAFAPFVAFMSGSFMNHVPTLTSLLIALACMARVMTSDAPRPLLAAANGLALGFAATIRPLDAFAFALPAGVWYLSLALRDRRRWRDTLAAGAGVALPIAAMMGYNLLTTGAPLLFGYEVLWGKSHGLGFHDAPWGVPHTPVRGVELINIYLLRLQAHLFEAPLPSLIPFIGALALARHLGAFDRYLLISAGVFAGLYFAYWHNGEYLGPRFFFPLVPLLALWTARFPRLVRERLQDGLAYRATVYGYAVAGLVIISVGIPLRARHIARSMTTMRWDADSAAAAAGVNGALVLVRESWGAQIIARLWTLGVPRSETEFLYQNVDACLLEQAVSELERRRIHGMEAFRVVQPLVRDSARLIDSPYSPDLTQQMLPGVVYTPECIRRIQEDRGGFTLLPPLLVARRGNNLYARDLHARDSLLLRAYPERPVYLLRPSSSEVGAPLVFHPLSRDSLFRAWRGKGGGGSGERAVVARDG